MKKLSLLLICLSIIISSLSGLTLVGSAAVVLEGAGSSKSPYLIQSEADFLDVFGKDATQYSLATNKNIYFKQTVDLVLENYTPRIMSVTCKYNGNGHSIDVKSYVSTGANQQGVFSALGSYGKVENLTVKGIIDGTGYTYTGAIAGWITAADIINCVNEATVIGNSAVGGIAGACNGSRIKNCINKGPITCLAAPVGGIIGFTSGGSVTARKDSAVINCGNYGAVTTRREKEVNNIGGIVGQGGGLDLTVSKCFNAGDVSVTKGTPAAIIGSNYPNNAAKITVTDCFNVGTLTSPTSKGALVMGVVTASTADNEDILVTNFYDIANPEAVIVDSSLSTVFDSVTVTPGTAYVLGANGVTADTIINAYSSNSLYEITPGYSYPNFKYSEADGVTVVYTPASEEGGDEPGEGGEGGEDPEPPVDPDPPVDPEPEEPEEPEENLPTFNTSVLVEAESAYLNYDCGYIKVIDEASASGGKAVEFITMSTNSALPAFEIKGDLRIKFNIPATDIYRLKIRMKSGVKKDQFFYKLHGDTYINQVCKQTDDYTWQDFGVFLIDEGTEVLDIVRRESKMVFDAVMLERLNVFTDIKADYVERTYKDGYVKYPYILDSEDLNILPEFEDGDRVLFVGDSITHGEAGGYYHKLLFNYYNSRYPNATFTTINKGSNGARISTTLKRFDYDVYDEYDLAQGGFNKVVIMLGTNDMSRGAYFVTKNPESEEDRVKRLETYRTELKTLIEKFLADEKIEEIILQSPPMFDEFYSTSLTSTEVSADFNNIIRRAGSIMYEVSQEYDKVSFVDVNTPMTIIDLFKRETYGDQFSFVPDRLHPTEAGHYIMLYAFLKAQGESGEVATVEIDASNKTAKPANADVTSLTIEGNKVSYTYYPYAIPMGADSFYRTAEEYFPVTDELNREIIKVTGLASGNYDIKADGVVIATVTAEDLAKGVNIADLEKNPNQQVALNVSGISTDRLRLEDGYRAFVTDKEYKFIETHAYLLDPTSNATLIASAKESLDYYQKLIKTETNADKLAKYETYIPNLIYYIDYKEHEPILLDYIEKFKREAAEIAEPQSYTVTVEPSTGVAQTVAKSVYVNYELPEDTLVIIPDTMAKGVSIDKISVSDANGELSALPAVDTALTVKVTVTNNTVWDKPVSLWAASYKSGSQITVSGGSDVIPCGESKEITIALNFKAGADLIKAGLWNGVDGLKPYANTAVFPSVDDGIKAISINGVTLKGFDPSVTDYTYYVHYRQVEVPFVSAAMNNSGVKAQVTQANALGGNATVKANGKTYTIRILNETQPIPSGIMVDGVALAGFDPNVFEYTVSGEPDVITATVPDDITVTVTKESGVATVTFTTVYGNTRKYLIKY